MLKNETELHVCVRKLLEVSRRVDSQTALTLFSLGRALGFVFLMVFFKYESFLNEVFDFFMELVITL